MPKLTVTALSIVEGSTLSEGTKRLMQLIGRL